MVQRMSHFKSIGVVIVPVTSSGMTSVLFDGDNNCSDYHAGDLEPIPHPDTVRLNWLESETKVDYGFQQENFVGLREAIDNAMQQQAAE